MRQCARNLTKNAEYGNKFCKIHQPVPINFFHVLRLPQICRRWEFPTNFINGKVFHDLGLSLSSLTVLLVEFRVCEVQ